MFHYYTLALKTTIAVGTSHYILPQYHIHLSVRR